MFYLDKTQTANVKKDVQMLLQQYNTLNHPSSKNIFKQILKKTIRLQRATGFLAGFFYLHNFTYVSLSTNASH